MGSQCPVPRGVWAEAAGGGPGSRQPPPPGALGPQSRPPLPQGGPLLSGLLGRPTGTWSVGCRLSRAPGGRPGGGAGLVMGEAGRAGRSLTPASSPTACLPRATTWYPPSTTTTPACSTAASYPVRGWSVPACRSMQPSVPRRGSVSTGATAPMGSAVRACLPLPPTCGPVGRMGSLGSAGGGRAWLQGELGWAVGWEEGQAWGAGGLGSQDGRRGWGS